MKAMRAIKLLCEQREPIIFLKWDDFHNLSKSGNLIIMPKLFLSFLLFMAIIKLWYKYNKVQFASNNLTSCWMSSLTFSSCKETDKKVEKLADGKKAAVQKQTHATSDLTWGMNEIYQVIITGGKGRSFNRLDYFKTVMSLTFPPRLEVQ